MFTQLGAQRHPSRWDADGCLADDGDSDGDGDGCIVAGVHIDIHSCDGDDGDSSNG